MKKEKDVERIVRENLGLVYMQLHRFNLINDQDAESLAYEALWNAAKNFDPKKGNKFSTLAVCYIYNSLCNHTRKLKAQQRLTIVSYNNTMSDTDTEFEFILASDENVEYEIERSELHEHLMEAFNKIITRTKNPTRRTILAVWKRQLFSCSATYIARELGITPSYVSQVLKNTKHVLRKELEARNDIRREYN